ncbi:MAG TPA: capsule assembly Wzi family protein [Terracidiphilus sp.]|nr:capsule assembly Wzi family protein [Terracidiphilus sp.]
MTALAWLLTGVALLPAETSGASLSAGQPANAASQSTSDCMPSASASPYIPVDSWVYPAMLRLYGLGYVDNVFLGLRPWTRASVEHMLEEASDRIEDASGYGDPTVDEAQKIYDALNHFLDSDVSDLCGSHNGNIRVESVYTIARGISGTPLHDSFHLGSTIVNDYGRPYENGFNNYSGASGYASAGPFVLYLRGEFQGAPSAAGYSASLAQALSTVDGTLYLNSATGLPYNQTTIPTGPIGAATNGRFLEAYVSAQVLNHVVSIGKMDNWLGPAQGGAMAFSNNAQNFYAFEINRIEPLQVPLISRLAGPFRYEFLVGQLRGHTFMPNPDFDGTNLQNYANVTNPGNPWVHLEKISFKPTVNLEFGFERTAIWAGEGHSPATLRNFLRSFFSFASPSAIDKNGPKDPGARFGAFDFSYRVPFLRNWITLYTDAEVHDDVSPIDAPRRAAWRPGIYLTRVPGVPRLDVRVEAATTDPSASTVPTREYGRFMYWEAIERQGYTNQGQLFGDWIGREDKGGQAWITYHLSGNEWLQVSARNQKATKDFIPGSTTQTFTGAGCPLNVPCLVPGGTTINDFGFQAVKRIGKDIELNGNFTIEHWKAPIYLPGEQTVTTTNIQITWFPERKVDF